MRRGALVAVLAAVAVGTAAAGLPRNLTPPRLYGEFVAGRPVTLDPGSWTGAPTFQFFWERCTTDGGICKPAPDLGDEHATTVHPQGEQGYDVGVRLRAGVTVDHGRTWLWSPLSPVITADGPPSLQAKGGLDPYTPPRVGTLLHAAVLQVGRLASLGAVRLAAVWACALHRHPGRDASLVSRPPGRHGWPAAHRLDRDVGRRHGKRLADDEARPMSFGPSARR